MQTKKQIRCDVDNTVMKGILTDLQNNENLYRCPKCGAEKAIPIPEDE